MPQSIDTVKGHCPECGPDRNSDIIKECTKDYNQGTWGSITYRMLRCRGCDSVYFQISEYHSEEGGALKPTILHWPIPERRPKPNWRYILLLKNADDCYQLFEEIYAAFNSGNHILTAIGVRTAFDRISELLGATPEKSFGEKVKFLSSTGPIGATEEN